jgi:hypothetical protein
MNCIITGIETRNKCHNFPMTTNAVKAMKKIMAQNKGLSWRDAASKLRAEYIELVSKKAVEQIAKEEWAKKEDNNTKVVEQ